MYYGRGYGQRRYYYRPSGGRGTTRQGEVSRLYGGIDDDVRKLFFGLDSFRLQLVFNVYEQKYGKRKRQYAETTFANWQSGAVQMGGEISERLVCIVPEFLQFDQKYDLIEKLWNRLRQKTTLNVTISPYEGLNAAVDAVMDAIDTLGSHEIPDAVAARLEWLAQDDAVAVKSLLAQINTREAQTRVEKLEKELRQLLDVAVLHQDKIVTATRIVALPWVTVYITLSQTAPNLQRRNTMADSPNESNNPNQKALAHRDEGQEPHDLAPIQNPNDLLSEALKRISSKKQEEIVGKVAEEVARIQVKRAEGHADHELAVSKVEIAANAATRFGNTGHDFEVKTEHHSEHGSTNITVRNKPDKIFGKCFVATACYGDYSHPSVIVLRQFRDRCLRSNAHGRLFIAWYYRNGSVLADLIEFRPVLRLVGRLLLWPAVLVAYVITWLSGGRGK